MIKSDLPSYTLTQFYNNYLSALEDEPLLDLFKRQSKDFIDFLDQIPKEKYGYSYAKHKWTVVEVLVHIIDTERIFQYRALRFSRGDTTELRGFDQDIYVPESHAGKRTMQSIINEYKAVRQSTISLFENLTEANLENSGKVSGVPWTVGTIGFVICGHQQHHQNILEQRYL
ncbi:DinB family protein [Flavobacteriaceae bacterium F89]|uniref:DinB family protein n=1 Tax=Cerina litoralis TaxID=2874477 RepID=A0AAE3EXE3_9FLAO|nr:DinB family protein [Cerina litoralis]MCG2461346.1 DinB family protein [Cerina litoralis]